MQRPHLSTGAWIFATAALVLAVAAPVSYAAVTSTVAIGNANTNATATVTNTHQLLTTTIAPRDVVTAYGSTGNGCGLVYNPPAGKAIVVSSVTYDMINNSTVRRHALLMDESCFYNVWDEVDTAQAIASESHTFPIGLPMPSIALYSTGAGMTTAYITGYLIPASQLPAAAPAAKLPARPDPTHPITTTDDIQGS